MEIVFFFYIFVIIQVLFESFYMMQALNLNVLRVPLQDYIQVILFFVLFVEK